jgi:cephalosporin hydroxylase
MNNYYQTINGSMFDFEQFYSKHAESMPNICRVAEVGVADGKSLLCMASKLEHYGKQYTLFGIDNCAYGHDEQRNEILRHIRQSGLEVDFLQMSSLDASCKFNDGFFDFVFLDSSHTYEQTKAEIRLWIHKVKDGGILAGHDYDIVNSEGVVLAVNEVIREDELNLEPTSNGCGVWWLTKKQITVKHV